jgi:hypothetical protein
LRQQAQNAPRQGARYHKWLAVSEPKESPVGEETTRLKYRKFFPPDYSPKQVEAVILSLLRDWRKAQLAQA